MIATLLLAANLLVNPAFERNAAGRVKNWNYHYESEVYSHLAASEEDGRGIVSIEPHKDFLGLNQNGITVIPGNKYRIGAWVRTKGVKAKRTGILLYNWAWVGEAGFNTIPADTKGEWVKLEKTVEAMESSKGIWVMTLFSIDQTEGRIDFREPFLEPIAPVDSLCERPAVAFEDLNVITPISPLLARVPEKNAAMTFAYRYDLPRDAKDAEITAWLKLAGEQEFGHAASAKLAEQHATVKFGDLRTGDGRLKVQLRAAGRTLAENEYPIAVIAAVETGSPVKLNEQVQRLAKTAAKDGEIDFIAPKDGWVWMKLDRYDGETRIYLDGGERPVAHYRRLAPGFEAMRRVKAGRHTLRLAGTTGGELTVNAIPELGVYSYPAKYYPAMEGYRPYSTDEFKARWLYPNLNHFSNGYDIMDKQDRADVADYGFSYLRQACTWNKNLKGWECRWETPEEMSRRFIAHGCPPGDYRYGVTFDEIDLGHTREQWNFAQCSRLLWDAPKPLYGWHSGRWLRATGLDTEYVSALVNNCRGSGRYLFELYPRPPDNEAEAAEYLKKDLFSDPIGRMKRLMPAAISNAMVFAGCYIRPENNCYGCQNGEDMKAFYDMYFRILATDPEFAGMAGFGFYSYVNGDEELLRWSMTLFHHYFIEGRTESLAAKYGYRYRPELLTNGDFDAGLAGWNAQAAEKGSLEVVKIDGFRKRVTHRDGEKAKGDELCRFRRSEKGANRLERQLTGLKRGEYYALRYIVADAKTSSKADFASAESREYPLAAAIEGARDVTAETHAVDCGMNRRILKGRNAVTIVFRAVSDRAKVVFEDTAAKPGEELLLGCVRVAPYFFE